jgi:hypothetical protein
MATIKTAEGQELIVENNPSNPRLMLEARVDDAEGITRTYDISAWDLYSDSADGHESRPRSRGDLTNEVMKDAANRLVGRVVADHGGRRADVEVRRLEFYERDEARSARYASVPDYEEDWPDEGTKSDKVRYILAEHPNYTEEQIAAGVDCSRSLVRELKEE